MKISMFNKSNKFNINLLTVVQVFLVISLLLLFYSGAYADDPDKVTSPATVQGIRQHLVGVSNESMKLIMLIAAIAGVAYLAMGLFSLKAASDSAGQQNQNLQKGIVKIVLGGCLISLPFLMNVSNSVIMESESSGMKIPSEASSQAIGKKYDPSSPDY